MHSFTWNGKAGFGILLSLKRMFLSTSFNANVFSFLGRIIKLNHP